MRKVLSVGLGLAFVGAGLVANVTPALANQKPVNQATQVAAPPSPLPQKQQPKSVAPQATKPVQPQAVAPVATPPAKHVVPTAPPVHKPVEGPISAPVVRTPQQPASQPTIQQPTAAGNEPRTVPTPGLSQRIPGNENVTPVPATPPANVVKSNDQVVKSASLPAAAPQTVAKKADKPIDEVNRPNDAGVVGIVTPCAPGSVQTQSFSANQGGTADVSFTVSATTCKVGAPLSLTSYSLQHPYYSPNETQASYETKSGTYLPGSYDISVHVPNCYSQIDFAYQGGFVGPAIHPDYQARLIRGQILGDHACTSTAPYSPPVVKPPIDNVLPPAVEITCTTDSHRVGEKCVPNEAPKPVTQPIQTSIQHVTAPVSQPPWPQIGVPPQPQRIVNRLTDNNSHAVAATRPESAVPSAPVTGRGPATNELAETGAGPNPWLLVGLFIVLIGLLTLRVLDKLDRKSVEREVP